MSDYKPPGGLNPHYHYPDGVTPVAQLDLGLDPTDSNYLFNLSEIVPKLPLVVKGSEWIMGWDIPIRWAIDSSTQCWKDEAHGGALDPCSPKELVNIFTDEEYANKIRKVLGLKLEEPSWMALARQAGWTPPK